MQFAKYKIIILGISLFGFFAMAEISHAANHYVREGATGANNGADWTNAWTALPSALTRGDTYYIADGNYGGYTFDDPVSGEQYITIKKAIGADHGTDAGWQASYGDGQAVFSGTGTIWNVEAGYFEIDGKIGSDGSGYGFKLDFMGTGNSAHALNIDASNVRIRYADVKGNGYSAMAEDFAQDGVYVVGGAYENVILSHNYIHDWKRCGIIFASGVYNSTIEYNLIARTYSTASTHGQGIQIGASADSNYNLTIRYNKFLNVQGSGFIFYLGGANSIHHDIDVYGNVFWADDPANWNTATAIGTNTDTTCNNCNVYNNTFFGLTGRGSSGVLELDHGYGTARNNIFYNSNSGFTGSWTASHNASDDDYSNQANFRLLSSDPFVNSGGGNFNLREALDDGYDMSGLFAADLSGETFSSGGSWGRGAYKISANLSGQSIVIDHDSVDFYDDIPQNYLDEVKKMRINILGESHSLAYRKGLDLLEELDQRYAARVSESAPEIYREDGLRADRARRTIYNNWAQGAGEDRWYANATSRQDIKMHLDWCNQNNYDITAIGFGWCWDMTWHNSPGGTIDPVHNVRWAGSSVGGPEGDLRWGLDADDTALTGNSISMDTYLSATDDFQNYADAAGYGTKVLFTTGPVDGYSGENGYQRHLKHEYIRNYVRNNPGRILFDYADILAHSNSGAENLASYNGNPYQMIHAQNMMDYADNWSLVSHVEDGDHIGEVGAMRIGKAEWVLLAQLAGWDPEEGGQTGDTTPPASPSGLSIN